MRVLWIVNNVLPEADSLLKGSVLVDHKGSGGWILGLANALLATDEVELSIATVCDYVSSLKKLEGEGITYYLLPLGKGDIKRNLEYSKYWLKIRDDFRPDIVDIHGSEYSHGLAYIETCGADNVVLTMQGVMQLISNKYRGGLSIKDILSKITIHDILRGGILKGQGISKKRANIEKLYLQKVKYVIGRTAMDRGYTEILYPQINYYHCDEILRETFYKGSWEYDNCQPHSIFLSSAVIPYKGAHIVIKAAGLLKKKYPDIIINIAGRPFSHRGILSDFVRKPGYQKYLESLIVDYGLQQKIHFLGNLTAEEMKVQMLNANVFICSSSVENSSNSVSEAQLLGCPCVAACVGGVPSIVSNIGNDRLYPFDDYVQLASIIDEIFLQPDNKHDVENIIMAQKRHNAESVSKCLIDIYKTIIKQ